MHKLGARMVEDFFWMDRRGRGRWDVKLKEVDYRGAMHEGAEEEGHMQRCGARRRKRARRLGHVLKFFFEGGGGHIATTTG
jgi:hypothetical protein